MIGTMNIVQIEREPIKYSPSNYLTTYLGRSNAGTADMSHSGRSILPSYVQDLQHVSQNPPGPSHIRDRSPANPSDQDHDMEGATEVTAEDRSDKRRAVGGPGRAQYDTVCCLCP
jgi:hypothetical protein